MAIKKSDTTKKPEIPKKPATSKKGAATTAVKEKSLGELVNALAEKISTSKAQAREFLDAHAALLVEELKTSGSVQLAGIGKLKMSERAERQGRNPSTGEAITIKAAKTVKFSGGKAFKDSFNV